MDVELIETGNGGDVIKKPKDLSVIEGFENMPYLAMFGGNVEASTPSKRLSSEQAFDFWGNSIIGNDLSLQFNSLTERTLMQVSLNSQGREIIEQAVLKDLEFMKQFAVVSVIVKITATDRVLIGIQIQEPDNLQQQQFVYIWDATKQELIDREFVVSGGGEIPVGARIFGPEFDFSFE